MIDDCWNRIGVHGDASCPELETYVHCRNCPVYSTAAKVLLDVELPPGYLAQWTSYIAQERLATAPDTQSVVIFRVGIDWLALPTALFVEIADERAIHSIPQRRGGSASATIANATRTPRTRRRSGCWCSRGQPTASFARSAKCMAYTAFILATLRSRPEPSRRQPHPTRRPYCAGRINPSRCSTNGC
jgi:hypothetical protein